MTDGREGPSYWEKGMEKEVTDLLPQLLDLFLAQGSFVVRPGSKSILRYQQEPLLPVLQLRNGDAVPAGGLLNDGLPFEYAQYQGWLALGCQALD